MNLSVDVKISKVYDKYSPILNRTVVYVLYGFECSSKDINFNETGIEQYDLWELSDLSLKRVYKDIKTSIVSKIKTKVKNNMDSNSVKSFENKLMKSKRFTFDVEL